MTTLNNEDKVRLFRELTEGAPDCFAARVKTAREGEERWRPVYAPITNKTIRAHLAGRIEIGSYPLMPEPDNEWPRVKWICADFDGKHEVTNWKGDVRRAVEFLSDFDGCPCFVNLSRSGLGAHVRMLFNEPVPAWMARRWVTSWLTEAGIIDAEEGESEYEYLQPSFDRLLPPQDTLHNAFTSRGDRSPGNLAGSPLNGRLARSHSGTLPLSTDRVLAGDFEPDGRHWDHVARAIETRGWGEADLLQSLTECSDSPSTSEPGTGYLGTCERSIVPGRPGEAGFIMSFCEFMRAMQGNQVQSYDLWVAIATQLHRFGDEGLEAFHYISSMDHRYRVNNVDAKWRGTQGMRPVRCETLVGLGYTCPHLHTKRCGGSTAPAYLADTSHVDVKGR